MTNIANAASVGHNSAANIDLKKEHAFIQKIRKGFNGLESVADEAAIHYVQYALSTRNCDLVRHFWEALPEMYQRRLVAWLRVCAPIIKRTKKVKETGEKLVSFGLDKERIQEEGLTVYNPDIFSLGFTSYKTNKAQAKLDLTKLITRLVKSVDGTSAKLDGFDVDPQTLAKIERLSGKLAEVSAIADDVLNIAGSYSYDASELPGQRAVAEKSATKGTNKDNIHNLES